MSWTRELAALRTEVRNAISETAGRLFVWTLTANTTALGTEDQVQLADDVPSSQGQRPVRRLEPFGVRSRPPAKIRSLSLRLGNSTSIYLGVASDGGYGPGDLNDGETAVYNKVAGTEVLLDEDGNVAVSTTQGDVSLTASGSGKIASVNGTTYAMPQWDSFVAELNARMTSLGATPVPTTLPTAISTIIAMQTIFADFAATLTSASFYKSTKAKNG